MDTLDLEARYAVRTCPGIAFYLTGYAKRWEAVTYLVEEDGVQWEEEDPGMGEWVEDPESGQVIAIMVGDDREHVVNVDDLTKLEEGVCSCGQIGCGWDAE
jgi:hypothetical protein